MPGGLPGIMGHGMMRSLILALALASGLAFAQSAPNSPRGYVPSAEEWRTTWTSKLDTTGNASGAIVTVPGGTAARSLASRFPLQVDDIAGIHGDGVTDDTAALQTALNLAASSGRYALTLGPRQYLVNSASLIIPDRVTFNCVGGTMGEYKNPTISPPSINYSILPCYIRLNPAYTILRGAQTVVDGINVINSTYVAPTTMRQAVNLVAAFAGTAFTNMGSDATLRNSTILGFDSCSTNTGQQRDRLDHVFGDCRSGLYQSRSHDVSRYRDVHLWPFLTVHTSWFSNGTYTVNGLAPNGTGGVRVTITVGAEPPVTGDKVWLAGTQGLSYAFRGAWTVTVIDSTHIDLQGASWPSSSVFLAMSTTAGSTSATTTTVNAAALAGPGMLASGAGVAPGSTIVAVYQNIVILSLPAIATQSGGAVQVGPNSVAGGQALIDVTYRSGKAFDWNHSENSSCTDCFEFGHEVGYYFGDGAAAVSCTNCVSDNAYTESNTSKCIWFDAGSHSNSVIGGWFDTKGYTAYISEANSLASSRIVGAGMSAGSMYTSTILVLSGNFQMTSSALTPTGYTAELPRRGSIYIADAPGTALFVGNDFGLAKFAAQNPAAVARLTQAGNVSGGGP